TSPSLAASTSIVFSGAWTSRPSIEKVIVRWRGRGTRRPSSLRPREDVVFAQRDGSPCDPSRGALQEHGLDVGHGAVALGAAALDVLLGLAAELGDHRADRHR